jgi:pimeloyl-ACP methyl ester carboxylesterase
MATRRPTFLLIPGAGGLAWYWHLVVPELEARGCDAVAVDLPAGDEAAGLPEYAAAVVAAAGDRTPLAVVAQSLGGFTAPLVCDRLDVSLLVFVNAMIPVPGETAGDWWEATRHGAAYAGTGDVMHDFFHDVPADVVAEAVAMGEPAQTMTPFSSPPPLTAWRDVPIRVLAGRDDRFFPAAFQRRVAEERLGITPDEMPGGHVLTLSQPVELAERLAAYGADIGLVP